MIIWLASYPKSGNTWVRSFLSSLIYTKNGEANFESLKNIMQYPQRRFFNNLKGNVDNIYTLSSNWVPSQVKLNSDKKNKILKTHNIMCSINKNAFTDNENTKGVIYIVRDPRNVVTSIQNHFYKKDANDALSFILDENKIIGRNLENLDKNISKDNEIITLISSWGQHYNSWKNFKKNFLLLKYENLIKDPYKEFSKLREYLYNILNLSFSDNKFRQSVESNTFKNLKSLEIQRGFEEGVSRKNLEKKIDFFNLGEENDFNKILDKKVIEKIELRFNSEMKELNYI
tara:strand:- start:5 stop:865 length:861 start_codon:yes stop_codon:yes gene_type:complete